MNQDLIDLLTLKIPSAESNPVGFLEIAGMAHYEIVNSRVYAYFLNQNNYSELAQRFVEALLELVKEKTGKEIELNQYDVITEDLTNKNNRIDITLNDIEGKSAIIIENKIYHYLHNDLDDYWNHFNHPDENKIGILLTLEAHSIPEYAKGKFVNVTHAEWTNRIQQNGLPSKLPQNIYTYLNDFFGTIDQLTKSTTMNEQTKFYFEHTQQVLLAKQTQDEATRFIENQIQKLATLLGWNVYGRAYDWKNLWDAKNNLETYYTIAYRSLLEGELKFWIILELKDKDKERLDELDNALANFENFKKLNKRTNQSPHFIHYLSKEYTISIEQLSNFAEFVKSKIDEDFADLMVETLKFNYPSGSINFPK